jgi:hypothetical protein
MIVRESINFERGKSPEDIKKLFGREYHPGEILLRPDNGYSPHSTIMMFKRRTKPDYAGNEYFEVATLGYIDTEGKTKYYGYRFELDNYNTENMVNVDTKDIRFPSPKEELILRKFFNRSKISKIKERLGIFPILNGKKLDLNEAYNFERGLDPKDSMDIGTPLARLANELGMTYAEIRQDKKDLQEIVAAAVNPGDDEDKDYSFAFYAVADDPRAYDISKESRLFDVALWADQHQKDAIRILRTPDRMSESINFERGVDPRDSMDIGKPITRMLNRLGTSNLDRPRLKEKIEELPSTLYLEGRGDSQIIDIKRYKDLNKAEKKSLASWYASSLSREENKKKIDPDFIWIKLKYDFPNPGIKEWMDLDKFAVLLDRKIRKKFLKESQNFERGVDPKKSAGIGLSSPKRFQTIEEFTNHIIAALPLIFDGKIPEDILSKKEGGMLPETYYGKIAWWLAEKGFEMPNGNSEWEGPIDNAPKDFAYWTTPIVQKLEQMFGQKRWSEYN